MGDISSASPLRRRHGIRSGPDALLTFRLLRSFSTPSVDIRGQVTGPKGHWSESYIVVRSGGEAGANPTLHTLPHPFQSSHLFLPGSADFAMTRSCSVDRDSGNVTTDLLKGLWFGLQREECLLCCASIRTTLRQCIPTP